MAFAIYTYIYILYIYIYNSLYNSLYNSIINIHIILEIIINIDKNHKIYTYFSKKSKFFRHLKHIRMVPHLRPETPIPQRNSRSTGPQYIQHIYKIYQNISEIIININKNHKIHILFFQKNPNSSGTLNS